MSEPIPDIVDRLAGIVPGSRLDEIRHMRVQARENSQASYLALFAPETLGAVTKLERFALAAFVTALHGPSPVADDYMDHLAALDGGTDVAASVRAAALASAAKGPYGAYPAGPLSAEDVAGPDYHVADAARPVLGARLSAALEHAHMLVFHPRDSSATRLQALLDGGWSTTDIVTISQLVAFLSFQIRVVAGLRVLSTSLDRAATPAMSGAAGEN